MSHQQPAAPPAPPGDTGHTGHTGHALRRDVVTVLMTFVVVGAVSGVAWWWLWEPAIFTKVAGQGGSMGEVQLGRQFAGDGWYAVVAAPVALVAGIAVTAWRSRDLLVGTLLVVAGSAVAAFVMAYTGHLLGPGDPQAALATARPGDRVPVDLEVRAGVVYLLWPMAALIGALIVLWSPPASEQPTASTESWEPPDPASRIGGPGGPESR